MPVKKIQVYQSRKELSNSQIVYVRTNTLVVNRIQVIKRAYRKLAKSYHPDLNLPTSDREKFIEITKAYDGLIERLKRPRLTKYVHTKKSYKPREKDEEHANQRITPIAMPECVTKPTKKMMAFIISAIHTTLVMLRIKTVTCGLE